MTSSTPAQILLTGATGFIGGTILTCLLESDHPALKAASITCLVRGAERADTVSSAYGVRVRPVVYGGIDDLEATTKAASQADLVIGATLGFHPSSAQALLRGLAQRKAATGRHVWMIHLSGAYLEERTFDGLADDVYGYEKHREALRHYPQRATELGVKTLVVMPPTIYGVGTGLFNRKSIQIPAYVRAVLELGSGVVVGEGAGQANHVHVEDLAELYRLVVLAIMDNGGANLPTGKKGIVFGENGLHTWMDIAQGIADACHEEGRIKDRSIRSIDLEDAGKYLKSYMDLVGGDFVELELGLCANSSIARRLGWKLSRGEEAWKRAFGEDLHAVLRAQM
ncbi:NAD dependent epimerase/dehydratase [Seiridium cupressi]